MLIILLIFSSILFMKLLLNRMNRYIDENGKRSMGVVVEQIQQTYDLQVNGYYSSHTAFPVFCDIAVHPVQKELYKN